MSWIMCQLPSYYTLALRIPVLLGQRRPWRFRAIIFRSLNLRPVVLLQPRCPLHLQVLTRMER